MATISIIVPVFRVEKYLEDCIQSILKQTFKDFELVLVDDGSPDSCGEICDRYEKQFPFIHVIHQENQGLSGARNTGIEASSGEYITFVDSDDLVAPDYLSILYNAICKTNADISACICCDFEDGTLQPDEIKLAAKENAYRVLDGRTAVKDLYEGNSLVLIGAPYKLFKRELLNELRFPIGRLHEDQAFTPIALYSANRIVFTESKAYYYRVRRESITHQDFTIRRYDNIWAIDKSIAFFEKKGEQKIVDLARATRHRYLCGYAVMARTSGIEIPNEYRIGLLPALWYLRKHVSPMKYEYYLAQVSPKLVRVFEYEQKLKRIIKKEDSFEKLENGK